LENENNKGAAIPSELASAALVAVQGKAEAAAAAALTAQGKAEGAATASVAAQSRAEPAATAAVGAQGKAEGAATASVAAQSRAEPAATAAVGAQGKAETAATASVAAQSRAEPAATAAVGAQGKAEGAATASVAAQSRAEPAATAAVGAQGKAETAATASVAAQSRSETAASDAQTRLKEIRSTLENSITASLGGAFQLKANNAKKLDLAWLSVLVVGIGAIIWLGYLRYPAAAALIDERAEIEYLLFQLLVSIATLSGPIWLSWVATKRLARTFAISEDYAYKAALAQAYQGYRDSVKDADPLMQQRLFATVITQLDASPVRFLSDQHPATPFQDLLQQPWMEDVMRNNSFKEKFMEWFKYKYGTIFDVPKA
jgi:hypothetical protein